MRRTIDRILNYSRLTSKLVISLSSEVVGSTHSSLSMPKLNTSGGSAGSASRRNRLALILALLGIDNFSKSFAGLFLVNSTDRTTVQHAKIRKIIPELHRRIIEKKPIHTQSKQEKIINFKSLNSNPRSHFSKYVFLKFFCKI